MQWPEHRFGSLSGIENGVDFKGLFSLNILLDPCCPDGSEESRRFNRNPSVSGKKQQFVRQHREIERPAQRCEAPSPKAGRTSGWRRRPPRSLSRVFGEVDGGGTASGWRRRPAARSVTACVDALPPCESSARRVIALDHAACAEVVRLAAVDRERQAISCSTTQLAPVAQDFAGGVVSVHRRYRAAGMCGRAALIQRPDG